jgi:hypothetical protein
MHLIALLHIALRALLGVSRQRRALGQIKVARPRIGAPLRRPRRTSRTRPETAAAGSRPGLRRLTFHEARRHSRRLHALSRNQIKQQARRGHRVRLAPNRRQRRVERCRRWDVIESHYCDILGHTRRSARRYRSTPVASTSDATYSASKSGCSPRIVSAAACPASMENSVAGTKMTDRSASTRHPAAASNLIRVPTFSIGPEMIPMRWRPELMR